MPPSRSSAISLTCGGRAGDDWLPVKTSLLHSIVLGCGLVFATSLLTQCDDRRTENQKPRTGTPGDNRDTSTPTLNSDGTPKTQP